MKNQVLLLRLCTLLLLTAAVPVTLRAQAIAEIPQSKAATQAELSQAELLKSYLHVREQLHEAELAIANNRLEAEATARAQAAAIAEKLDTIKSTIAAERERQAVEAQRTAAEQERQRVAAQDANRIVLWVAAAFGGVGLLTMVATGLLQWRGIKRMTQVTSQNQQLPVPSSSGWLTTGSGPAGEAVALSNQRLMSVIDRMERRILELENTTAQPTPATSATEGLVEPSTPRSTPAALDQAARIAALLGKGRSLLNANKAKEAVACYDEILAIEGNHPEALVKKGSALERLKQDLEAIECYDRAIQADRNMALAYLSKGGVFNRLQRFDEAVECYEKALQVEKAGKPSNVVRVSVSGEWPASGSSVPA
jgi:tetratricopeptide (TPR) repeat protein